MKERRKASGRKVDVDWEAVRMRIEHVRHAIEDLVEPCPSVQERILEERSLVLAKPMSQAHTESPIADDIKGLAFQVAGERYAFVAAHVAYVYPMQPVTAVPGIPDFIVGIMMVQASVISVVDLRLLLELPLSSVAEPSSIIVLQNEKMKFGVLAETVFGVARYSRFEAQQNLAALANIDKTCLMGVTADRIGILDAEKLLSDPRMVINAG